MNECIVKCIGFYEQLKIPFSVYAFSASPTPSLISSIYGVVVTSQNGGDNTLFIATRGSRIRE